MASLCFSLSLLSLPSVSLFLPRVCVVPFLYILNSTIRRNLPLPAYFLFFGETPNPVAGRRADDNCVYLEYNSGPWFNANVTLARLEVRENSIQPLFSVFVAWFAAFFSGSLSFLISFFIFLFLI